VYVKIVGYDIKAAQSLTANVDLLNYVAHTHIHTHTHTHTHTQRVIYVYDRFSN